MNWVRRPVEEQALFNPAFGALLLWEAAIAAQHEAAARQDAQLHFATSFLVLPMVLHEPTRAALPASVATSAAAWLSDNPLMRSQISVAASVTKQFTKEALLFGANHGLFRIENGFLNAEVNAIRPNQLAKVSKGDVHVSRLAARFVGRWFALAGNANTVMTLFGTSL